MPHPIQSDTRTSPAEAAIRAANRAVFRELWIRDRARLLGRARGLCGGDAHAAEDLLAQVALNIWTYLETCPKRIDTPRHFLARVMKRLAIDHHRRKAREARLIDHGIDPHDADANFAASTTDPDARLDNKRCLRRLDALLTAEPTPMQALFRARFIEALSYREIATRYGVSEMLARKRIQALRRRLKASLDGCGDHSVHTDRAHTSDHVSIT